MFKKLIGLVRFIEPMSWALAMLTLLLLFCLQKNLELNASLKASQLERQNLIANAELIMLKKERLSHQALSELQHRHNQKIQDEISKTKAFIFAVKSGAIRLSVPIAKRDAGKNGNSTVADNNQETRAELTTEAGTILTSIDTEGNQAIIDLNFCIDSYNKVQAIYNEKTSRITPVSD